MSYATICLLALGAALIVLAMRCRRRSSDLRVNYRRLEEYAHTLLQHGQGTILNVQGIVSEP